MESNKPIPKLHISILLWVVSILLKYFTFAISVVLTPIYYLVTFKWKSGSIRISEWFYNMAIANDQTGNVQSSVTFQLMFTKKIAYRFGDPDDTVSYVLGRNKYKGMLNSFGRGIVWLLDKIDNSDGGHIKKAVEIKIESDLEAVKRVKAKEYYE